MSMTFSHRNVDFFLSNCGISGENRGKSNIEKKIFVKKFVSLAKVLLKYYLQNFPMYREEFQLTKCVLTKM